MDVQGTEWKARKGDIKMIWRARSETEQQIKEDEQDCWGVSRGLSVHVPAVPAIDNTASPASSLSYFLNGFPTQMLPEEWED